MRRPAPTIRLRLTVAYGGLFLACGIALLTITYVLVQHEYTGRFFLSSGRQAAVSVVAGQAKGLMAVQPTNLTMPGKLTPEQLLKLARNPKLAAAAAQGQSDAALHQLLVDSAIALALMALFSIWLGWVLAGRALSPLRTITRTAQQISASSLHRRLDLEGPEDELTELGRTFDRLLERLESAFDAQRRFVANASHELRTPLTLERALLELALSDPHADVGSYRRTCEKLLAVNGQQERLIEALLTLSRSQRGLDRSEPVDLGSIAAAATAAVDHDGLALETRFEPAPTSGDPRLLDRLVANLVDNAVRHNVPGGTITVRTGLHEGRPTLWVESSGELVPPHDVERLLRPFERRDRDGRGSDDGLGLGLSIVDAIAAAHGATLSVAARPEGGLDVAVAFPVAAG